MSEAGSDWDALDVDGWLAQVETLRSQASAAPRPDPVRLHYIEALARRLPAAAPAVQKVLQTKLVAALKAMGRVAEPEATVPPVAAAEANETRDLASTRPEPAEALSPTPTPRKPRPKAQPEAAPPAAPLSLLGQLNQHIQTASPSPEAANGRSAPQGVAQRSPQDLKSAVRFRETWARISAETEVDQAGRRAPENAGPLNAHNLVLRTLSLMRELSPDYLRRFMSHTESLLWLDQAVGQLKQPVGKAKSARAAKPKR